LGLHCFAFNTRSDELVLNHPSKNSGSAYGNLIVTIKVTFNALFDCCLLRSAVKTFGIVLIEV